MARSPLRARLSENSKSDKVQRCDNVECVIIQCAVLNRYQEKKFTFEDQFVMAYGGLRGAIAFGLLSSMPSSVDAEKRAIYTSTTITVICFTVFFQGATIRPLLNLLKVERQKSEVATMVENVYNKKRSRAKYLKPFLTKHRESKVFDASQIVRAYQKIALRETMEHVSIDRKKKVHNGHETHVFLSNMSQKMDKADVHGFLLAPENAAAVYSIFSPLIDQKICDFVTSQLSHSILGDEDGDIKDDFLTEHQGPPATKRTSLTKSKFDPDA